MESEKEDFRTGQRFSQAVNRLKSELDRLTDMAWTRGEEVWGQFRHSEAGADWTPEMDLVETDQELIVIVNLPGIAAERVDVTLVGNTLELSAETESLTLQPSDRVLKRERPTGIIHRVIALPVAVDNNSAVAHAEQGVLKITMKKTVDRQSHKVPVVTPQSVPPTM